MRGGFATGNGKVKRDSLGASKSLSALAKRQTLDAMEHLLDVAIEKTLPNGHSIKIRFDKEGNQHLYSDTFNRSNVLKRHHLPLMDEILQKSTYVGWDANNGHNPHTKNIRRFHYFLADFEGKAAYINVAEKLGKRGRLKGYFAYSVSDHIKNKRQT